MIIVALVLGALALLTSKVGFVWAALVFLALGLISIPTPRRPAYFMPFSGNPGIIDAIWYHCPEHGDVPIQRAGCSTLCPTCQKQMEKGKKL